MTLILAVVGRFDPLFAALTGVIVLCAGVSFARVPKRVYISRLAKRWAVSAQAREPSSVWADAAGLSVRAESLSSDIKWSHFKEVGMHDDFVYLVSTPHDVLLLSTAAFASDRSPSGAVNVIAGWIAAAHEVDSVDAVEPSAR